LTIHSRSDTCKIRSNFKEEEVMKGARKGFILSLVFSLALGLCVSEGWTQDRWHKEKYSEVSDLWAFADLAVARPLAVAAGLVGAGIFVVTLPFTLPTKSTDAAAHIFIVRPFKFSFVREFPDENY
jgi:hypothetical protein